MNWQSLVVVALVVAAAIVLAQSEVVVYESDGVTIRERVFSVIGFRMIVPVAGGVSVDSVSVRFVRAVVPERSALLDVITSWLARQSDAVIFVRGQASDGSAGLAALALAHRYKDSADAVLANLGLPQPAAVSSAGGYYLLIFYGEVGQRSW